MFSLGLFKLTYVSGGKRPMEGLGREPFLSDGTDGS